LLTHSRNLPKKIFFSGFDSGFSQKPLIESSKKKKKKKKKRKERKKES